MSLRCRRWERRRRPGCDWCRSRSRPPVGRRRRRGQRASLHVCPALAVKVKRITVFDWFGWMDLSCGIISWLAIYVYKEDIPIYNCIFY